MSYNITLQCGCTVYVACHPVTGTAHTRVLEKRHPACAVRSHEVGLHLEQWELLPQPALGTSTIVEPNRRRSA